MITAYFLSPAIFLPARRVLAAQQAGVLACLDASSHLPLPPIPPGSIRPLSPRPLLSFGCPFCCGLGSQARHGHVSGTFVWSVILPTAGIFTAYLNRSVGVAVGSLFAGLTRCFPILQRLREAIDSRIAEEQARQKSAQDSLSRSNSARQPSSRNLSPSRRPNRPRRNTGTPVRGPDPTEFEPEFTIGDDEASSRSATPQQDPPSSSKGTPEQNAGEDKSTAEESPNGKDAAPASETKQSPSELPAEVKVKLRKLSKMETRYQGMRCSRCGSCSTYSAD